MDSLEEFRESFKNANYQVNPSQYLRSDEWSCRQITIQVSEDEKSMNTQVAGMDHFVEVQQCPHPEGQMCRFEYAGAGRFRFKDHEFRAASPDLFIIETVLSEGQWRDYLQQHCPKDSDDCIDLPALTHSSLRLAGYQLCSRSN